MPPPPNPPPLLPRPPAGTSAHVAKGPAGNAPDDAITFVIWLFVVPVVVTEAEAPGDRTHCPWMAELICTGGGWTALSGPVTMPVGKLARNANGNEGGGGASTRNGWARAFPRPSRTATARKAATNPILRAREENNMETPDLC